MSLSFQPPTAGVRRRVLNWTTPWHVLCLSALFVWGHYPLSAVGGEVPASQVYLLAVLASSVALAAVGTDRVLMFDRPPILWAAVALFIGGSAVIGLPLLGLGVPPQPLAAGLVAAGMGTSLLFVLWCECLAFLAPVRVMFLLCVNTVLAALGLWFFDHLDGTGAYAGLLCCAAVGCMGVRRSWEINRGRETQARGRNRVEAAGNAGASWAADPAKPAGATGGSAYHWRTVGAVAVIAVCLVMTKSLACGTVVEYISWGGFFAPVLLLAAAASVEGLRLAHVFLGSFALAVLAALCLELPVGYGACAALCDAAFTTLFILLGTLCSGLIANSHASVCRMASVACAVLSLAALLGGLASGAVVSALSTSAPLTSVAPICIGMLVSGAVGLLDRGLSEMPASLACALPAETPGAQAGSEPLADPSSGTPVGPVPGTGFAAEADAGLAGAGTGAWTWATGAGTPIPAFSQADVEAFARSRGLQRRRTEVLGLLLQGKSSGQIASELVIAQGTVKAHIHGIYQALDVHSREELAALVAAGRAGSPAAAAAAAAAAAGADAPGDPSGAAPYTAA